MIFKTECKFLGKESKQSKKGNTYTIVSIMQGVDVLKVMSDIDIDAEFGTDFVALLDYNTQFKQLRLVGAEQCKK